MERLLARTPARGSPHFRALDGVQRLVSHLTLLTVSSSAKVPVLSRRSFVAALAAAWPSTALVRRAHALSVEALRTRAPAELLRALARVVLPSELGAERTARVAADFQRWIVGYREGAELTHAYGSSRIRFTGPTPATRWTGQLEALDRQARRRYGRSFAEIAVARREEVLRTALAGERLERIPSLADAHHVAVALIAFFYESPAATDLCYGARIGRQTCRPLAQATQKPVSIRTRP